MGDLDNVKRMLPLERAKWCAGEMRRSAEAIRAERDPQLSMAAEGNDLMADTFDELAALLSEQARIADFLGRSSRYLLDMLTASNEAVDAMYGKRDTLDQAAVELRKTIEAWEEGRG